MCFVVLHRHRQPSGADDDDAGSTGTESDEDDDDASTLAREMQMHELAEEDLRLLGKIDEHISNNTVLTPEEVDTIRRSTLLGLDIRYAVRLCHAAPPSRAGSWVGVTGCSWLLSRLCRFRVLAYLSLHINVYFNLFLLLPLAFACSSALAAVSSGDPEVSGSSAAAGLCLCVCCFSYPEHDYYCS